MKTGRLPFSVQVFAFTYNGVPNYLLLTPFNVMHLGTRIPVAAMEVIDVIQKQTPVAEVN